MKLNRVQQKKWDLLVAEARERFKEYNRIGLQIADLALKACDIVHGGGRHWDSHQGVVTVQRFAVDIGMPYKTLHYWICLRRDVLNKIPNAILEGDRGALRRTQRLVGKNATGEEVAAAYQRELQRPSGEIQIERYIVVLKRLNGLIAKGKYRFEAAKLAEVRKLTEQVLDTLNDRMRIKGKRA